MRKYFGKLDSYLCYLLLFAFLVVISYLMTYDSTAENGIRLSCNEGEDLAHCDSGEAGIAYETGLTLKKGEYELSVYYAATSEENEVIVQYEDMIILDEYLEVTDGLVTKYTLQIPQDIAGATLSYRYSGSGSLDLFYFTLVPLQPWYHDAYLRIGLLWLVVIGLIAMRICTKRGDIECKKRVVELFCVFIIGIMAALPFLADTSFLNGDDSTYHVYRIFKIKETLDYGIFPAVIYPTGFNSNSSLGAMYPYLFLYIPAFTMKILGASLVQAVQNFIVLISIATALVAYYSLRSVNVSGMVSVLFTLLYVFMNYRLENVYRRFAMGEYLAMIFFPLFLAGLYHLTIGDKKKWWILTLAMTGLLQSHILSFLVGAVIAAVVGLCYMVVLIREKRVKALIYSIAVFLLLNIWFLVPFIQYYLFGELNTDIMPYSIRIEKYWTYDPTFFLRLIDTYDMDGYEYFSFGIPTTAVIFMTILFHVIHEKKDGMERKRQVFTFILTIGAFAMFFLLCIYMPYYKLEEKELLNTIFGSLQFLWRLLGPSVGMILFAFAILLSDLKLQKYYKIVIIASLSVLVFINVAGYSYYYEKKNATLQGVIFPKGEEMPLYYSKILDVPYGDVLEYRVVYTNKETLTSELKTSGDIDILNYNKDYLKADIQYVSSDADANVTIPLQKYIGYKAYDEEQNELVMKRSEYGTIQIDAVPDGQTHEIHVRFREPIIWRISELVSLLSCIVLISSRFVDYKKLCNKLGKVKLLPKHNK